MTRLLVFGIAAVVFAASASGQKPGNPASRDPSEAGPETRYLAFQIFTYSPDPKIAFGAKSSVVGFPDKASLRAYIDDIKQRIGTVGNPGTRLAVVVGPLTFDNGDAEISKFVELAFNLALETDVAIGFHIDDSMF